LVAAQVSHEITHPRKVVVQGVIIMVHLVILRQFLLLVLMLRRTLLRRTVLLLVLLLWVLLLVLRLSLTSRAHCFVFLSFTTRCKGLGIANLTDPPLLITAID